MIIRNYSIFENLKVTSPCPYPCPKELLALVMSSPKRKRYFYQFSKFSFRKFWLGDNFPTLLNSVGGRNFCMHFSGGMGGKLDFTALMGSETLADSILSQPYLDITTFIQLHAISTLRMLKFHFCLFTLSRNNALTDSLLKLKNIILQDQQYVGGKVVWWEETAFERGGDWKFCLSSALWHIFWF